MVRNNPGLNKLVITAPFTSGGLEGRDYRIYVKAFNSDGSTDSQIATITLGDVPNPPSVAPLKQQQLSTTSAISVQITDLPEADTRGLPVLSYCLEIDRVLDNIYTEINGCSNTSMALTHLIKGLVQGATYGFRYRARNAYGWGGYSQTALLKVATEPGKPMNKPSFVSATDSSLTIELDLEAVRSNGEAVT